METNNILNFQKSPPLEFCALRMLSSWFMFVYILVLYLFIAVNKCGCSVFFLFCRPEFSEDVDGQYFAETQTKSGGLHPAG